MLPVDIELKEIRANNSIVRIRAYILCLLAYENKENYMIHMDYELQQPINATQLIQKVVSDANSRLSDRNFTFNTQNNTYCLYIAKKTGMPKSDLPGITLNRDTERCYHYRFEFS